MFPMVFSDFWMATVEEEADLSYVARDILEEMDACLAADQLFDFEQLLDVLIHYSMCLEDPILQAKIRLDVARVGMRVHRLDIARTGADYVVRVLEGHDPRFRRRDAMLSFLQNHYLAKCYYILAIIECQNDHDRAMALTYLHKCLDKVGNLNSNPFDHTWAGNNHYHSWEEVLRLEIDGYIRNNGGGGGGGGARPYAPYPGGTAGPVSPIYPPGWPLPGPASSEDSDPAFEEEAAGESEPEEIPVTGPSGDVDLPPVIILKGNNIGPLPIMGELSIGEYIFSAPDPLIPEGSAGFLRPQPGQGSVPVSGPETSEFKIEGARYHLHDLRREGGVLEIDPIKDQYFIVCVKDVTERFAGSIHPGDYLLVHPREIVGINDLIFYERYIPYEYWYKLDQYIEGEIHPQPHPARDSGKFQDEADHAETKSKTLAKGIVIGVFKPIR